MIKKNTLRIFFIFLPFLVFSQKTDFSSLLIPSSLKENANAVVRSHKTLINVLDTDDMVISVDRTITVLNKLGNRKVGAVIGYDDNSKINKLSARIYDAFGKEIKKITKSKFVDVSAVDGETLYSDSRLKYLDYTPTSYPYTVHLEYQKKTSSTGFLPNWSPIEGYLVSVEENTYQVNIQKGNARVKEKNFKGYDIEKSVDGNKIFYAVKNISAVKNEALSPSLEFYEPIALVALNNFKTDGVNGYYTNWNEFGLWMYNSLLKGRDLIDETTKTKILELVKGIDDPIEKAKIVYQFMQDKTRYISVQVGIGGIQPFPANEVDNLGYGDCKGLTNYTKALLDVVGVTSYYTHIEANSSEPVSLEKDFASLEQGNHVILNIPNKGNDIWLECTNQTIPFGFLGTFTDNRDVLVITPEGGVIKRTTSYKNEQNLQATDANIQLLENGSVKATLKRVSKGTQYNNIYYVEDYTKEELVKVYKSNVWDYNNNLEINNIDLKNDKENVVFTETLDISIANFATINENEYLFRVNIFNRSSFVPKRYRKRKLPLKITRGYNDEDQYTFKLPKGYTIDVLPPVKELITKFGAYKVSFKKIDDTTFTYHKSILIKEGVYPKEDYKLYRSFRRGIAKYENIRIAILKK
ncbi:DUF3857 domain-containing protein [Polaribacter sp. MSW13]|uniref:DUF3857 domain-containing protein n=1 Tax=Polaribacter marinus TaxID=2916838 RepID=A0A9X1VPQ8_9FLAO|nr:DUF3857 domain-containing protein [Polaribacter marinus]MCI2228877.1 DUF3857 domain-containing protein [Polaribacter marinus]